MKKNILYVSPFSNMGGAELSIITLIQSLDPDIFSARLLCYEKGPFIERIAQLGIEYDVFERTTFFSNFVIILKLYRYMRQHRIDMVHVNSLDIRAALAARLAGVKLVGHLRVIIPFTWRDRFFVILSHAVISVSYAAKNVLLKGISFCKKKFFIIPCAIQDPGEVIPADLCAEYGLPQDAQRIGLVGRIDPFKGHEVFIDAATRIARALPNAYFFIIGSPNPHVEAECAYLQRLHAQVKASGIERRFIFTGFRSDIMEVIAGLSLIVVPSLQLQSAGGVKGEGFGRVAAEAMAVGVPVIVADSGGLTEIVEDRKTGFVVPSADAEALAEAMRYVFSHSQEMPVITQAAKARFDCLFGYRGAELVKQVYMRIFRLYHGARTCGLCGARYFESREFSTPGFSVVACTLCGLVQVTPIPDSRMLAQAYGAEYYKTWVTTQRDRRVRMWERRMNRIERLVPSRGRLLDVGCADGSFLAIAHRHGWDISGTEVSSAGAALARGLVGEGVFCQELSQAQFPDNAFDVVTLWHVLEHVPDPLQLLYEIRRVLKPGGSLFVAAPNLENTLYRWAYRLARGKRTHLFDPRDRELHLYHFSVATLTQMLERAGLSVLFVCPDRGAISISQRFLNGIASAYFTVTGKIRGEALEAWCRRP